MKLSYEYGDRCWIAIGPPPLWEGRVMAAFTTPRHPNKFYIIEVKHPDYPQPEVRDALLMSDTAEGPLLFMQAGAYDEAVPLHDAENNRALIDNLEGNRLEHDGHH